MDEGPVEIVQIQLRHVPFILQLKIPRCIIDGSFFQLTCALWALQPQSSPLLLVNTACAILNHKSQHIRHPLSNLFFKQDYGGHCTHQRKRRTRKEKGAK